MRANDAVSLADRENRAVHCGTSIGVTRLSARRYRPRAGGRMLPSPLLVFSIFSHSLMYTHSLSLSLSLQSREDYEAKW